MTIIHDFPLILLPGVVEDILEVKLGLQMTKHDRIIIILDPAFEIMKISLLWTELFNFPKRGADLAKNRLESTLCHTFNDMVHSRIHTFNLFQINI